MLTHIKNGLVVDPKNRVQSIQSLYILGDEILGPTLSATEYTEEDVTQVIDATGLIVTPGFIDMHMHEDPINEEEKVALAIFNNMLRMGVTSAFGGNCGINTYSPSQYLDIVDAHGCPINVGLFAGHTYARNQCEIDDKYRPLTDEEIHCVAEELHRHLKSGCFGISYGIRYVPGLNKKELIETAKHCLEDNLVLSAHVRSDATGVFDSVQELIDIGEELKLPVQVSHIGSMGGFGQMEELLEMVDRKALEGMDIACDCYPYYAFSTRIGETTYDEGFLERYHSDYSCIEICSGKYRGMRCTEEIFKELREHHPQTLTVCHVMDRADIDRALMHPNVMVASDGLTDGSSGHPRASGTFPKFIKEFIKTERLSLIEGIDKITYAPARRLGLEDRGHLSPGAKADITIFSLEEIEDKGTFEEPMLIPEGLKYVFVNGTLSLIGKEIQHYSSGRALRKRGK